MEMTLVESSTIAAIGYDETLKVLVIRFKQGGAYKYADVTPEDHAALMSAESKGKYFLKHIKPKYMGVKA